MGVDRGPRREASRGPRVAMWVVVAAAAATYGILVVAGWGAAALPAVVGLALLACVAVCVWAALAGRRNARQVDRAIADLARRHHQETRR